MEENKLTVGFIGDDHARGIFKKFIKDESVDHWVLMGDLVDNDPGFDVDDEFMIENLQDAIDFKRNNMDKVTLLIGNHSNSYIHMGDRSKMSSRYRSFIAMELHDLYTFNADCFQNAWQYKNVIASHAGIQHNWFVNEFHGDLNENIADQLNNPKNEKQLESLYDVGYIRGGRKNVGGIFWCDRSELLKPLKNFTQVVGHNRVKEITHFEKKNYNADVYFVDCLGSVEKYLKLEI